MTNGEKIKEIFPRTPTGVRLDVYSSDGTVTFTTNTNWWNVEYEEPITENCIACKYDETEEEDGEHCKKCLEGDSQFELDNEFVETTIRKCFGCKHSKDNHNAGTEECHLCMWENQYTPTTKKCTTCAYREIDGKPHEMCKSCVCGDRYRKEPSIKNDSSGLDKKLGKDFDELDCIDREVAIKAVEKMCPKGCVKVCVLKELPPVTPQPRKGHWEHGRELSRVFMGDVLKGIIYEDWHCSNCHCVVEQSIKPEWNYCPNCGCRMVEPQESEEGMKANTHIVIKRKDIFKYLTDNQIKYLDAILNTIVDGRKKDGKETDPSYFELQAESEDKE